MVQPDKRLLWHPRNDNKFVVGGNSQITLYEWAEEYPEIRHVTSQNDLLYMKCFAWSPDPSLDDLMAVGLSTGKVDLFRIEAGKQAQRKNILSSGNSVTLPVRNSRACNSLAFSSVDSNYLAVGLDKVRGDSSLVIWDIGSFIPSLILPIANNLTESSILKSSNRQRPQPPLPRLENQARSDTRMIQQHAPAEIVSSLAFLPTSTNLLLAGISHRWLRLFDLRIPTSPALNVASKVQGIAIDPFDPHRVATFGDSAVTVWDARRLQQPFLIFSEKDASADGARITPGSQYGTIEFSSTRRGCLATLEKESTYVRFWDIKESNLQQVVDNGSTPRGMSADSERGSREFSRATRRSWAANLPWPTGTQQLPKGLPSSSELSRASTFILADTHKTKYFSKSLASFALVPNLQTHPHASNIMLVNNDGDLELYAVHDTTKQLAWSARGDITIGAGVGLKFVEGYEEPVVEDEVRSEAFQQPPSVSGFKHANGIKSQERRSRSRSRSPREESRPRGRKGKSKGHSRPPTTTGSAFSPALFGREDDVSVLLSTGPTGISATKPVKPRTYSPAAIRRYNSRERGEPKSLRKSPSRPDAVPAEDHTEHPQGFERKNSQRSRQKSRDVKKQSFSSLVQDDISMVMRKRAKAGYGLTLLRHNILATKVDEPADGATQHLSELWEWLYHSQEVLCLPTSHLQGYDFSFHGLLGIWEGITPSTTFVPGQQQQFIEDDAGGNGRSLLLDIPLSMKPSHHSHASSSSTGGHRSRRSRSPADDLQGNWIAALSTLAARMGLDRLNWKSPVITNKSLQRQIALQVCGWSVKDEELGASIKSWVKEGQRSRAACWLVFSGQRSKAVELLMRSDDETHQMMSGTIAALAPLTTSSSSRSLELREHYGRLIIRLHDPYFRVMLTHLVMGDWSDVLEEDVIPFRERMAIAFQFLDDKALTSYLRRTVEHACIHGSIDALIVTGLTPSGLNILQEYLNRTGDVQSAAILSSYVCPMRFKDKRAERWLESYRDLLDGFKLHHLRVGFDIERGQILHEAMQSRDVIPDDLPKRQILIQCHYCNKPVSHPGIVLGEPQTAKSTSCIHCGRELPRCSICLMTLSITQDAAREVELGYTHSRDTFDDAIVICQTCRHGGHALHILEWFIGESGARTHDICPVADCRCRCADEF